MIYLNDHVEKIFLLDFREKFKNEDSDERLQAALRKIKPLAKFDKDKIIPQEKLEKLIFLLMRKFPVKMQWVSFIELGEDRYIKADIIRTDNNDYCRTLYGITTYELFAKCCLFMYSFGVHIKEYPPSKSGGNKNA